MQVHVDYTVIGVCCNLKVLKGHCTPNLLALLTLITNNYIILWKKHFILKININLLVQVSIFFWCLHCTIHHFKDTILQHLLRLPLLYWVSMLQLPVITSFKPVHILTFCLCVCVYLFLLCVLCKSARRHTTPIGPVFNLSFDNIPQTFLLPL